MELSHRPPDVFDFRFLKAELFYGMQNNSDFTIPARHIANLAANRPLVDDQRQGCVVRRNAERGRAGWMCYDWSMSRWWMAYNASSRRSETPSLSKMLWRWFLTVCSEMKSFSPISLLRNPWATSCTISFSRSLSKGFSRRGPDSADFENAFMTSAVMRLSSQISPACTR